MPHEPCPSMTKRRKGQKQKAAQGNPRGLETAMDLLAVSRQAAFAAAAAASTVFATAVLAAAFSLTTAVSNGL